MSFQLSTEGLEYEVRKDVNEVEVKVSLGRIRIDNISHVRDYLLEKFSDFGELVHLDKHDSDYIRILYDRKSRDCYKIQFSQGGTGLGRPTMKYPSLSIISYSGNLRKIVKRFKELGAVEKLKMTNPKGGSV